MITDNQYQLLKYKLINDVYSVCYPNVHSLYSDNVGIDLAYVTQAILTDQRCELNPNSTLVKLLKAEFGDDHPIWPFMVIEPTVFCVACKNDVLLSNALFCPPINGWIGNECYDKKTYECIRCGLHNYYCECLDGPYTIVGDKLTNRHERAGIK